LNYYQSRQLKSGPDYGKWHYTCMNNGQIYPVGYCGGWPAWLDEGADPAPLLPIHQQIERERLLPFKDKFHTTAHDTPEAACECYKTYLLDTGLRFTTDPKTKQKCEVCGEWTDSVAEVTSHAQYRLCPLHNNRAEVEKLFTVGSSASSF